MLLWLILILDSSLPPTKQSFFYEYTVSQSGISWWLNKLFDFWIILRLTEFEMWAACNVLLAQRDELCYWQRRLHMTFLNIIFLCWTCVHFSLACLPGWVLWGQVQKCNLQYSLLTPVNCHAARRDCCLGDQTHISYHNQGTLSIISGFLRTCIISQIKKKKAVIQESYYG